ncbi:Xyloglucanase [Burkholderiales bacterium]|nr:Xyloglucanase [Burkholderiales bacterium]
MFAPAHSFPGLATALLAGALAGCATLGQPQPEPLAQRHARLQALCATEPQPSDQALGKALSLSAEAVGRWRDARSLDADQICRLPQGRLARSLARAKKENVTGSSEEMREFIELFHRDAQGRIPDDGLARALDQRDSLIMKSRAKAGGIGSWSSVGPDVVAGRVRAILFDRGDPTRVYLGAATGGIWISTDTGNTWSAVNDFASSLTISSLAQDPNDVNVLYAGTGEWVAGFRGVGIMKSTNRGASWTRLNTTDPGANSCWRFVQDVATHPSNSSMLFAGNWCGIYRSTDGGQNWTRVHQLTNSRGNLGVGWRILFSPTDANRVLAATSGRQVALSTDGGASFTAIQVGSTVDDIWLKRVNIAWSKSSPNIAYASVNEDSGDIYKSIDAGATWTKMSNPKALGNQGEYGNTLWVDPTDASTVIVGGIDLHRSIDGGATFSRISDWSRQYYIVQGMYSAHADHHVIAHHPGYNGSSNRTALFGTDGGVYRADAQIVTNVQGWQVSSGGLVTTQFYAVSGSKGPAGLAVMGGTQDNSTFILSPQIGSSWRQPGTGDGGPGYFDPAIPTQVYYSTQYLNVARWNVVTDAWKGICKGITEATKPDPDRGYEPCGPDATQKVNFIAPYIVDPANGERIFAGAASLWLTEDARTGAQPAWRIIKAASATEGYISAVTLRPGNANHVWVGHNKGEVYFSSDALGSTPTWTRATGLPVSPNRIVSSIVFDPSNTSRLFVTFGGFENGNLWTSDTYGSTWRDISAGLPTAPIYSVAVHPTRPNVLYVGTEVGLFVSEDGGSTWNTQNNGPAATLVRVLFFADSQTLIAGTYGRGIWQTTPYNMPPTIDVVEFYNTNLNHYFVTGGAGEIAIIESGGAGPGWSRTGDQFKAYGSPAPGAQPVCRFYGNPAIDPATGLRRGPNSHFYTINAAECEFVKQSDPGWVYEGIAFYAYPLQTGGVCAAGQVPVYRAYNQRWQVNDSNHRYTTSLATYNQMVAQGWSGESVVICGAGN